MAFVHFGFFRCWYFQHFAYIIIIDSMAQSGRWTWHSICVEIVPEKNGTERRFECDWQSTNCRTYYVIDVTHHCNVISHLVHIRTPRTHMRAVRHTTFVRTSGLATHCVHLKLCADPNWTGPHYRFSSGRNAVDCSRFILLTNDNASRMVTEECVNKLWPVLQRKYDRNCIKCNLLFCKQADAKTKRETESENFVGRDICHVSNGRHEICQ